MENIHTTYRILGPRSEADAPTYWSNKLGWTEDFAKAETFPVNIITYTLPVGSTGVMPFTVEMEPVGFYRVINPPTPGEPTEKFFKNMLTSE